MASIITTDPDSPYDVELAGVGRLGGNARGGFSVERAAQTMPELQDEDGQPLTGHKLRSAAEKFAAARGLKLKSVDKVDDEELAVGGGAFPDGRSIEDLASEVAGRDRMMLAPEVAPRVTQDAPVADTDVNPQPIQPTDDKKER